MSKSSDLSKTVKRYIINNIDSSGYQDKAIEADKDKVQFLKDTFCSEFGWRVEQLGEPKALAEYFAGLPSSCTVAFMNQDILELAEKWGSLPSNYTERQAEKILENWWNLLACKTGQLFRGNYS